MFVVEQFQFNEHVTSHLSKPRPRVLPTPQHQPVTDRHSIKWNLFSK